MLKITSSFKSTYCPLIASSQQKKNNPYASVVSKAVIQSKDPFSSLDPFRLSHNPTQKPLSHLVYSKESNSPKICQEKTNTENTNGINNEKVIRVTDELGRLVEETFPSGLTIKYEYVSDSSMKVTLPDESEVHYNVLDDQSLEIKRCDSSSNVLYQYSCKTIDNNHTTQNLIADLGQYNYQFDEEKSLLTIDSPGLMQKYEVDSEQNILSKLLNEQVTTYSYNENDELICNQPSSDVKITYDQNGRVKQKITSTDTFTFTYDALDRLTKVDTLNKTVEYGYDDLNRRVSKTVTENGKSTKEYYTFMNDTEIAVYDENNNPKHVRILGNPLNSKIPLAIAIESNDKTYAPVYDRTCNITQLIDTETKEKIIYDIEPFGNNLMDFNLVNPWVFASKSLDADTGLINFGYRNYDPALRQWMTKDPIENADPNQTYSYCNNNPIKYSDPDGRFIIFIPLGLSLVETLIAVGIGALGATAAAAANKAANKTDNENAARALRALGGVATTVATDKVIDMPFPDRELPRDPKSGNAIPDTDAPHTQLGWRKGKYPQAREFDENGEPIRDIDFTDHDRPNNHPLPHQHRPTENPTGGTKQRGEPEKVPEWNYE